MHGDLVPYGCDRIGKHSFPSQGREYQPQAVLLHQFPPFLAQRQLRGSPAASAPARQTGQLLVLLPPVLCQYFGFSALVCFGFWIWTKDGLTRSSGDAVWRSSFSFAIPRAEAAVQRERGVGELQWGWLGCLFSLNFCPVWPYVSNEVLLFLCAS